MKIVWPIECGGSLRFAWLGRNQKRESKLKVLAIGWTEMGIGLMSPKQHAFHFETIISVGPGSRLGPSGWFMRCASARAGWGGLAGFSA
jgi:hypothetical protein